MRKTKVLGVTVQAEPEVVSEYEQACRDLRDALAQLWTVIVPHWRQILIIYGAIVVLCFVLWLAGVR